MVRPFEVFDELFNFVETLSWGRLQIPGFDLKGFLFRPLRGQSETQEVVDGGFQGTARPAHFGAQQLRDVFVNGESGAHIMMLT
jgi:hypothetical protein